MNMHINLNNEDKNKFSLPNVFNEELIRKTGNIFHNANAHSSNTNNQMMNDMNQNNNIINLIQGKNEQKEYENNNNQSPGDKRQTYYLSNQFNKQVFYKVNLNY